MITFRSNMDDHAMDVYNDKSQIGSIQWHKTMRFVPNRDILYSTENELKEIIEQMEKIRKNGFKPVY